MSGMLERLVHSVTAGLHVFISRDPALVLRDIVDILFVATLIYVVLAFLKGTRAMQIALGMGFLIGSYVLARRIGLITTWTILDVVLTYIVLIVVILFQDDIRRGLMRVGRSPFFRNQKTAKETAVIEEVLKAASSLASKRIGALMVFEREAGLDEFIEEGTVLDAEVSKELLFTTFIPSYENPMHDGAVIIREGRIWQAGAFLPLTGSKDRTLGARHRAALGISEQTDAVVVVVSEERGAMSLCFDGNIVRSLDVQSMRDALFGLFYRPATLAAKSVRADGRRDSTSPRSTDPSARNSAADITTKLAITSGRELPNTGVPEAPTPSPVGPEERGRP
jgi:diadenylate cyclase